MNDTSDRADRSTLEQDNVRAHLKACLSCFASLPYSFISNKAWVVRILQHERYLFLTQVTIKTFGMDYLFAWIRLNYSCHVMYIFHILLRFKPPIPIFHYFVPAYQPCSQFINIAFINIVFYF